MKHWKPWVITGICCCAAGLIFGAAGIASGALNQEHYAKKWNLSDYHDTVTGHFSTVLIDADYADITIQPGTQAAISAEHMEDNTYQFSVENDTLQITQKASNKHDWLHWIHIGPWSAPTPTITLTLPEAEYRAVAISSNFGECSVSDLTANTFSLDVDCGSSTITGLKAASCNADCSAGELSLTDSEITGNAQLNLDDGDLSLNNTVIGSLCRLSNNMGNITMQQVSSGTNEITLDCGSLSMQNCTQEETDTSSTYTLSFGDLSASSCVLYQSQFTLDYGDLKTTDTALLGKSTATDNMGDINLNLRGSQSDYQVISDIAGNSDSGSNNQIRISGDDVATDISVSFTEKD